MSQHWAAALMGEWTSQAMLEKFMDLPCTVQCSDDPLTEASGQVFFINTFAKPLLELMVEAIPGESYICSVVDEIQIDFYRITSSLGPVQGQPQDLGGSSSNAHDYSRKDNT